MGRAKEELMRQQELEPMYDWIAENYGLDSEEEDSEDWNNAIQEYEDYCENRERLEAEWDRENELQWYIYNRSQIVIFDTQIQSVIELLESNVAGETHFSLVVMLHAHTVASVESYLASTFIHQVTSSSELIRKLVETDPEFSKRKFTLKEIFEKQESLKLTVATYLQDLIFHKISKVKPMFKDVLDCDFGDISWLIEAVKTRHHCVHRAGLDKDGDRVNISASSIRELTKNSYELIHSIEQVVFKNEETDDLIF
jgi:hypothetical protein